MTAWRPEGFTFARRDVSYSPFRGVFHALLSSLPGFSSSTHNLCLQRFSLRIISSLGRLPTPKFASHRGGKPPTPLAHFEARRFRRFHSPLSTTWWHWYPNKCGGKRILRGGTKASRPVRHAVAAAAQGCWAHPGGAGFEIRRIRQGYQHTGARREEASLPAHHQVPGGRAGALQKRTGGSLRGSTEAR